MCVFSVTVYYVFIYFFFLSKFVYLKSRRRTNFSYKLDKQILRTLLKKIKKTRENTAEM